MKRILNPSKYIKEIVSEGKTYYIGFGTTDLTEIANENTELTQLIKGYRTSLLISGKRGVLRENIKGKMVRKQPEAKTSIWRHIEYYSTRFSKDISFDRQFHVWEKELLHKYQLELEVAKTPQGEIVLHFPIFTMEDNNNHYMRAGAAMNMAIALGSYFMLYDSKFEPIVPVTKFENRRILPSGEMGLNTKLEIIETKLNLENTGDVKSEGNSYRFAVLKEKEIDDVTMGSGGFNEYLMFEYKNHNIMILENLKSGNATYIFDLAKFDKSRLLDKQTASKDPSFLKRVVHENIDSWSKQIAAYFAN